MAAVNHEQAEDARQLMGPEPRNHSEDLVDRKINPLRDKRLQLTGHSLGGGLSSAVCCYLDSQYPDIAFHSVTFNAAGVHANTVRPAALGDAVANNFTVSDEILTTLQSYVSTLPFVGAVFAHASRALGMSAMPPALGTPRREPGRSPGGTLGEKGAALPDLFPVSHDVIPILSHLDGMLRTSPSITEFGSRFLEWLNERYREAVVDDLPWYGGAIWTVYADMFDRMMVELEPELALLEGRFTHSAEYHGMDVVIATYETAVPG